MSAFIPILRSSFLYLSRQGWLRRWFETSATSQRLTSRFIAGLTLDDGLRAVRDLKAQHMLASLDHLGENVHTLDEAQSARDAYLSALERIAAEKLDATISMKVTSLGLDISPDACLHNTGELVQKAKDIGTRIELDMEASEYTDRNLEIVRAMHDRYQSVRAVIQAYLYRSGADVDALCNEGIPVRLCKGAYKEPASVAYPRKKQVDENYVALMKILLDRGAYPALATHDDAIVDQALAYIRLKQYKPERFEFEMLYGVRRDLQRRSVNEGYRVRVYVPYGDAWYPYFMRRLAERPANVAFLLKSLIKG